jgi:hypothetical protein
MGRKTEGVINEETVTGAMTLKSLILRWAVVFLLSCGVCIWTGCGGGSDDSDDTTDTTDDTTSGKSGVYEQNGGTVSETGKTYAATATDESAVYVYGAGTYTLSDSILTKTGAASNVDDSNFTGANAIVLAEGASTINLTGCTLSSDSEGSNGVFAYQKNSIVNVHNCTIATTGNSARGVDATYGGTINIYDSTITTTGAHCSALATDRYDTTSGEPKVNAYRVTGTVSGDGSVGVYSTGAFYVEACDLTSNGSGAAVIEGTNSITLVDTDMTVTLADKYGVMVYQSMSGDALGKTGTFEMTGGSLTVNGGPILLNTNDEGYFTLKNVVLSGSEVILKSCKCDWGATATNGGVTHFTADNQDMNGDFKVDDYGDITASLTNGSSLIGAIDPDDAAGPVRLTLDSSSLWIATSDSYVDEMEGVEFGGDTTPDNIDAAGGVTIYYSSGTGLSGNYTLTSGGTLEETL